MFEFDALTFSLIVLFSALIPGLLVGMLLLRKSALGLMEKVLLSFFIGLLIVPTLLFLEEMAGVHFSFNLALIDLLGVVMISICAWGYLLVKGDTGFSLPKISLSWETALPFLLLFALLLAFWIRLQPFSPVYSELDPYWYVYGTAQVIQLGYEPVSDDSAWWPEVQSVHIGLPLKKDLEAEWYALYTRGGAYDNYLLFTTSSWEPPISAAMLCFGAYLIVSSIYSRRYGVLVAFLLAVMPISIFKMSAGVNEASPISMGLLFLCLGVLAYSLSKKDKALYLFTAFFFFAMISATTYSSVLVLPFTALMIGQSVDYFMRGKRNFDFIEACGYACSGLLIASVLQEVYTHNIGYLTGMESVMVTGGFAFALLCYFIPVKFELTDKKRLQVVGVVAILSLAAFFFTPIGGIIKEQVKSYIGNANFKTALEKTIAEQNVAGESFEGDAGFLALVPASHLKDSFIYMPMGWISSLFTTMSNLTIRALDIIFNFFIGLSQLTPPKQDSILFIFLVLGVAGLIMRHFSRKEDEREIPSIMILVLAVLLPVFYIGMNKLKFTVFAGVAIAFIAAIAIAEAESFFMWLFRKRNIVTKPEVQTNSYYFRGKWNRKKHIDEAPKESFNFQQYVVPVFVCLALLVAYLEYAGPASYGHVIVIKSFTPRYQDNPIADAPIVSKLCTDLKAKGVPADQIQSLCTAGSSPETFSNTTNGQFDSSVCWLSQMSVDELFPANNTDAQHSASEAIASAQFRCNRIADYWISSMEWIKTNLNSSDRVTSWWDYGHWINYFANTNTVLRNEHASRGMIGRVAHDYIVGSTQDLIDSMNYFDSQYALFDSEIIGGTSFGAKYGALNYLGCVHEGATSLDENPGTSDCEFEHSPERIVIPKTQTTSCVISESQQLTGTPAYEVLKDGPSTTPAYCIGTATLVTGDKITATYDLNKRDANGDLALNKGFVRQIQTDDNFVYAEMVYTEDVAWMVNGTAVSGIGDAKSEFYKSNLYKAFYLKDLPGFSLVYDTTNVKIYKLNNFTGNKAGKIDPAAIAMQN